MNPLLWSGGNHEAASICKAGHVEPCEQDNNFLNFRVFKDVSQMNTFSRSMLLCAINNKLIKTLFLLTKHSIICGNKMPNRCNRGFYYRSYCLLNMFRALLCPSSGSQEYYKVVAACVISWCGFQVIGLVLS